MANEKDYFVTLDEIVKSSLVYIGEENPALYQKLMNFSLDGANDLKFDVMMDTKRIFLTIDTATMTSKLPDDFVQWVSVGLRNSNGEFMPLVYNDKIILQYDSQECHCDCGCNDCVCSAIGQGNVVTTTEDVVINGVTYTKYITTCTKSNGDVVVRTEQPTYSNVLQQCLYTFDDDFFGAFPLSDVTFYKNSDAIFAGTIANIEDFTAAFVAYGFTVTIVGPHEFKATQTTSDTWVKVTYTPVDSEPFETDFVQSACATPTPNVEYVVTETPICNVEVKPCGCIVPSQTSINILQDISNINISLISRWRYAKDFGQTFKTIPNYFGEFGLDPYLGLIKYNFDFQYDTAFLEYYSSAKIVSKDNLLPLFSKAPLVAWNRWQYYESKPNYPAALKQRYRKMYYNEKRLYRERNNPARPDIIMNSTRTTPRP